MAIERISVPLRAHAPALTPNADKSALLVKLTARPDFSEIEEMPRGADRKQAAYDAIVENATQSQSAVLSGAIARLTRSGLVTGVQSLVSPNMLIVTPKAGKSQAVADALAGVAGIGEIFSNANGERVTAERDIPTSNPFAPWWGLDVEPGSSQPVAPPTTAPYGLRLIGAHKAWARGAEGEGMVYGSIDTGVDVTHEALVDSYRGTVDGTDDYNFFDPGGSQTPIDKGEHGTHTVGTVLGAGIGVAPKAKFIAASALGYNVDGVLKALQWMLAPTRMDGTEPDATRAPDVVGMSWWTGKNNENLFLESMQDLRAAGIEPIKSAGNNGPGESTISSPGQYPEVISVAAVNSLGKIANFSSRGPAPYPDGATTDKPDYAMPGVDVISSTPGGVYKKMSGTSMAQPHMSGAILDILSAYPELTHDQLLEVLTAGAVDKGDAGYDFTYGNGLINLPASLDAAARLVGR